MVLAEVLTAVIRQAVRDALRDVLQESSPTNSDNVTLISLSEAAQRAWA
jgi:hypothetical protein